MKIYGLQKLTLLDYPGEVACTVFLGGCNFRCPFCHNASLALCGSEPVMTVEELLCFLKSRLGRLTGVCISGGEPTLSSDLPQLIRQIKALGYSVKLDTNGTNPDMLSSLISDGLIDYVAMDVKNSIEKYSETAGLNSESAENERDCAPTPKNAEDMLQRVKKSAEILMQGRVDFEFRTTLAKELHTEEDMRSIGEWLSGGEKFFLQTYRAEGDQIVGGFTPFTPEQTRALLEILREYIPMAQIR